MTQTEIQWFIARDGQQHGPVSDTEMKKLVELGHLRPADLVWRQGFPDWRPALAVFPPAAPVPSVAPQAPLQQQGFPQPARAAQPTGGGPATQSRPATVTGDPRRGPQPAATAQQRPAPQPFPEAMPKSEGGRKKTILALVAGILIVLGLGTWIVLKTRGNPRPETARSTSAPVDKPAAAASVAAVETQAEPEAERIPIANPELDARLQKVPAWKVIRRDFPQWYGDRLKEAAALGTEGKTAEEVDKHLVGEIMKLRRQNAKDALAAPPENLKSVASAFLENLKALESYGVPACHAFIFRGEVTGVVVEMMHSADKGEHINAQIVSIFDAIAAGRKSPVKHESPQKTDYDVLAAELSRLGWNQSDIQLFADPRALGSAPPSRVCTMVQDWFKAHLAVSDASVQERLLFETLKPVVGG